MTTDRAVVCLERTFSPGQAYVSLSRVTSLKGLVIEGFHEKYIYCDKSVSESLKALDVVTGIDDFVDINNHTDNSTCIMLHNVQGLAPHFQDLKSQREMVNSDFICLTETWVKAAQIADFNLEDFKCYHQIRALSYDDSMKTLQQQNHGGVSVYGKSDKQFSRLNIAVHNIEYVAFHIMSNV